ncbi:hypothetical protein CPAV1605_98 [seawater metagenome]|uniref:Uncharacterized protein n=1 Tax=seawater metagenome TaxID=1561972 RepID=A0A5E8CH72_9ZZZZ
MTTIKNRCQEWGIVNSHFLHDALQFDLLTALKEKIDNSYSAGAKSFIIGKYQQFFFLYDDMGMTKEELEDYINLYRAPPSKRPLKKNSIPNIGKHGLGGKEADCILSSKDCCNILSTNDGNNYYKINMNYKTMFDDISKNISNPWSKNMKIEKTDNKLFNEFLNSINLTKKVGTIFLYHQNAIYEDIEDLSWKIGLHYEDLIDDGFEILYYDNHYTKVASYNPVKPSFISFPENKHPKIYFAEIDIPIYSNLDESEFYVNDLRFMDKRINLKWNRSNNRCVHCKNNKCIPEDVILLGNFKFKISALMDLNKEDKELIQKKEIEYFGKQLYGCRIKRLGVQTGDNCWLPNLIRKNENMWTRCTLSYELGDTGDFDIFFQPGINKSKINPKNLIHNLVKELFIPFRSQFPKHQKDGEVEENNYSELESFSDSEFDKSESDKSESDKAESDNENPKYNHDNVVFISSNELEKNRNKKKEKKEKKEKKNHFEDLDLLSDESSASVYTISNSETELESEDEIIYNTNNNIKNSNNEITYFIKKITEFNKKDKLKGQKEGTSLIQECHKFSEPVDFHSYLQELNSINEDISSENLRLILLRKCCTIINKVILN